MLIYFTCGLQLLLLISPTLIGQPKNVERTQNARLTARLEKNGGQIAIVPIMRVIHCWARDNFSIHHSQIEQSKSVCDMSAKDNRQTLKKKKKRAEHVAWTFPLSCARMAVSCCWWEGVEFVWPPPPPTSNNVVRDVFFWPYSLDQKSFHTIIPHAKETCCQFLEKNQLLILCVCQSAKSIQKCEYF